MYDIKCKIAVDMFRSCSSQQLYLSFLLSCKHHDNWKYIVLKPENTVLYCSVSISLWFCMVPHSFVRNLSSWINTWCIDNYMMLQELEESDLVLDYIIWINPKNQNVQETTKAKTARFWGLRGSSNLQSSLKTCFICLCVLIVCFCCV